ncbi:MAG TPA: hypothetical protein VHT91_41525 [Kofleriaceae bacterium]|jgi:hypothetical protein|nr:hypothetical protein [Kofleriaceae bacterium]
MPKPKCTGIATRLAGVWDAATKAGVEHGFASKRSFACLYHATGSYYDKYELTTSKGIPVTMDFKDAGHYRVTGRLAARGIARVRPR